jgi:acyl-coenzyme A thioesterase PaaI-like protein
MVNFLRPVTPGELIGCGRVVHRGGHIAFLAGELLTADRTAVAPATATARVLKHNWTAAPSH